MNLRIIGVGKVQFKEQDREYDVVSRDFGQEIVPPRHFTSYNKGRPFISDEVPENYRSPMVLHELCEFELFKDEEDRCLNALKIELESVSESERGAYVNFRKEVFRNLILYIKKNKGPMSQQLTESKKSLYYLENLVGD